MNLQIAYIQKHFCLKEMVKMSEINITNHYFQYSIQIKLCFCTHTASGLIIISTDKENKKAQLIFLLFLFKWLWHVITEQTI